jgi:RNA polymerase sigma-70 factor (ECF subfamily)
VFSRVRTVTIRRKAARDAVSVPRYPVRSARVGEFGVAEDLVLKPARADSWAEPASREAALVERCAAGDEFACADLVAEHERMVYHLALNLLGDPDEALETSQEVFLRVFRTIHAFRGQSALRTWIFRIVINQARNRQRWWNRRQRRQQVSLDEHIEQNGEMPEQSDASAPDRALDRKELAARIATALEALPFDQRTAIVLREVDGLSYDEIAFSLGVTLGTVKARLTRARQALRAALKETRAR